MLDSGTVSAAEWIAVKDVVARLSHIYPEVAEDIVTAVVHQNHARFDGRRVRDFVPLFVERSSNKELAELRSRADVATLR
jgi:hypothetical protein